MRNSLFVSVSLLLVVASACHRKSEEQSNEGGNEEFVGARLSAASLGAYDVRQSAGTLAVLGVDAVRGASVLGAGGAARRTFGSLVQDQAGQFTYQPTPTDRLQVRLANGRELELQVNDLQGDVAAGGVEFFRGEHVFDATIRGTDLDLHVVHAERGRQSQGRLQGQAVVAGMSVAFDLALAGASFYDRGFGSFHYELDERITGTLRGDDLSASVDETTRFVMIGDARDVVSQSSRRFAGVWQVGAVSYELRDGVIARAFRGGNPNELDTAWAARGTLLRDGQPIGGLRLGQRDLAVRVWLDVGERALELESHQVR